MQNTIDSLQTAAVLFLAIFGTIFLIAFMVANETHAENQDMFRCASGQSWACR